MSKPSKRILMVNIGVFIVLPLLLGLLMYGRMQETVNRYMENQVAAQANILRALAARRFSVRLNELGRVADYFRDGAVSEKDMGAVAGNLLKDPNQISFGILRLDGSPVCGRALRTQEYPSIQNSFRGRNAVRFRQGEGLLLSVPIFNNGNIKYTLYEFFDGDTLFDSFAEYCFKGQCDLMLADADQEIIMPIETDITVDDPYFQDASVRSAFDTLSERMVTASSAAVHCRSVSGIDFIFTAPIQQSGMYLVGIVPYDAVSEGLTNLTMMVLLVFALLVGLLTIGTLRVLSADVRLRESDALREAKRAAEEASRSKSEFLANMSHELRTPINTIMGMDELILRETMERETRERAIDIKSASQILLSLIGDVLDFSKIESGQLKVIPVEYDLTTVIQDLVLLSEDRARSKSLEFRLEVQPDLPVGLFGDDLRIRQVLINLLTNAVKYTPEGSVLLRVTGSRVKPDVERVRFEVTDTGIGIKEEDVSKMLLPYTRAEEERNRTVEGSGLGLAIITNLLHLMDSHLEINSVYGFGSTFAFDLDQRIVEDEPIGDIQSRLSEMTKKYEYRVSCYAPDAKIMMVDDNSMNRRIFASLLKPTGISVTTVSSGQKCLDLVQEERFDIIFMDHLMPDMDGVETLLQMKALEKNLCKDTPVIALTANAFSGAQERYIAMGFDGFLAKPVATEKLEATIRRLLPEDRLQEPPQEAVPEAPEPELPQLDGVNWDYAHIHLRDSSLLLDSLRDFAGAIGSEYRDIAELAAYVGTEEGLAKYRIRVHALKSTSAMVGILSVSELARMLEGAARAGETERVRMLNPVLLEELRKTEERLRPIMDKAEDKKPLEDPSVLPALLDMLRADLAMMDIAKTDEDMKQLGGYLYDQETQAEMDTIARAVSNLDFDEASEAVTALIDRLLSETKE